MHIVAAVRSASSCKVSITFSVERHFSSSYYKHLAYRKMTLIIYLLSIELAGQNTSSLVKKATRSTKVTRNGSCSMMVSSGFLLSLLSSGERARVSCIRGPDIQIYCTRRRYEFYSCGRENNHAPIILLLTKYPLANRIM